jgi:hypothetical protein
MAIVAGVRDDEDAGPHGGEGGHNYRVMVVRRFGGSADGQRDDVGPIVHRHKDGRHQGFIRAAPFAARLVDGDVRLRSHAGRVAAGEAVDVGGSGGSDPACLGLLQVAREGLCMSCGRLRRPARGARPSYLPARWRTHRC